MQGLRGGSAVAWAAFDAEWYLAAYPAVRDAAEDSSSEAVLYFYLQHGRRLGHSPNSYFDEGWYLRTYADAAAAVRHGEAASGFDHYCRTGFRDRSPHWLFDEALYQRSYPDLDDTALTAAGLANGYDHYLRHGARENRIGHWLFAPGYYREQLGPDAARHADAAGPFRHYLGRICAGRPEVQTSPYFDPGWYLRRYPEAAEAVAAGSWQSGLHHYLCNDTPTEFDPLPEFSEAYYLERHPEIASAVAAGELRNGYRHFLDRGRFALNPPRAGVDLRYYVRLPSVRTDLREQRAPDAFTHYLLIGRRQGLSLALPPEEQVGEAEGRVLFRRKAENLLPVFARAPLSFTCTDTPEISVVIPVHQQLATSLATLAALRHAFAGPLELILIDAGGSVETGQIERFVEGAGLLRLDREIGPLRSRNAGLQNAAAEAVLFLGNEVEPAPGAVAAALRRLRSDPAIAAVCGKVVAADGRLREAGGLVEADGTARPRGEGLSPLAPEINFACDVDFASTAFLLGRTATFAERNGLDPQFATARYAAADLGARLAASGHRIAYDPAVAVHDYSPAEADAAGLAADRGLFAEKHRAWLAGRAPARRRRLLFIESMVPSRMLGSGFVRSNDILRAVAALGWAVTVFPLRTCAFDLGSLYRDLPDTAEVLYDRTIDDLPEFLARRAGDYDAIWVCRTHNLDDIAPALRAAGDGGHLPPVILDTEAIASLRDVQQAVATGTEPPDLEAALQAEYASARLCHGVVAVNEVEAEQLRAIGQRNVRVVGHTRPATPSPRPFAERDGLLFVGAIRERESPNYDALCWFADEVLPRIEEALGWETRLTVAGDLGDGVSLDRFRHRQRLTLCGMVPDLEPLYDSHRLFVAPTRFAAGIPYKVYEAASFGLPVVATDRLCRQMGWETGHDIAAGGDDEPAAFAQAVVALYRDASRWQSLRDHALERLRRENNAERYAEAVAAVLDGAVAAPRLRLAAG